MNKRSAQKEILARNAAIRQACSEIMQKRAREMADLFFEYQKAFARKTVDLKTKTGGNENER